MRREGLQVKTPASADCQAALLRRQRLRLFCNSCGTPRSEGWSPYPPRRKKASGRVWMRLSYDPRKTGARGFVARRAGQGRPRVYFYFASFLCSLFPLPAFFGGTWGEGDRDVPLGRYGSLWVDTGRGWESGEKKRVYNHRKLPWPFGPHVAG